MKARTAEWGEKRGKSGSGEGGDFRETEKDFGWCVPDAGWGKKKKAEEASGENGPTSGGRGDSLTSQKGWVGASQFLLTAPKRWSKKTKRKSPKTGGGDRKKKKLVEKRGKKWDENKLLTREVRKRKDLGGGGGSSQSNPM